MSEPMHPAPVTDELLLSFLVGETDDAQTASVQRAIRTSPALAERAELMRKAISNIQNLGSTQSVFEVSAAQERRLAGLMADRSPGWLAGAIDRAAEVVATIVLNTIRNPQPAVGFRGAAAAGGLVRAASDGVEIDFRVSDAGTRGRVLVQGQATPAGPWHIVRASNDAAGRPIETNVESDGYFEVELPLGTYRWELVGEGRTIVVEPFALQLTASDES